MGTYGDCLGGLSGVAFDFTTRICLRGIACALLAGVLVAPPVIASQEYLFMCKVLCILKDHSPGTVIRDPEQPDFLEARWWPCGGYTLRSRKLQGDVWRFDVPD